jgi:hypothetical protein
MDVRAAMNCAPRFEDPVLLETRPHTEMLGPERALQNR